MRDVTTSNFGLLIAYVIPEFVALWGAGSFSPTVEAWHSGTAASGIAVTGFLQLTLPSVFAGLFVRWLIMDATHHRTGIATRQWNYAGGVLLASPSDFAQT